MLLLGSSSGGSGSLGLGLGLRLRLELAVLGYMVMGLLVVALGPLARVRLLVREDVLHLSRSDDEVVEELKLFCWLGVCLRLYKAEELGSKGASECCGQKVKKRGVVGLPLVSPRPGEVAKPPTGSSFLASTGARAFGRCSRHIYQAKRQAAS